MDSVDSQFGKTYDFMMDNLDDAEIAMLSRCATVVSTVTGDDNYNLILHTLKSCYVTGYIMGIEHTGRILNEVLHGQSDKNTDC